MGNTTACLLGNYMKSTSNDGVAGRILKRPPMDVVPNCEGSPLRPGKRYRADAFHTAFVAERDVVTEHAQWRNPEIRSKVEAVDAAISAGIADECNRVLARE